MRTQPALLLTLSLACLLPWPGRAGEDDSSPPPAPLEVRPLDHAEALRTLQSSQARILAAEGLQNATGEARARALRTFRSAMEEFDEARLRLADEPEERPRLLIPRLKEAPRCDGVPEEWAQLPGIRLDRWEHLWLAGPRETGTELQLDQWRGSLDTAALFRAGWDERHLYCCVVVQDDAHRNPNQHGAMAWNGDSLQIAVSSASDPPPGRGYQTGDSEWVCARLQDGGSVVWNVCLNGLPAGRTANVPFAVSRVEQLKHTVYEVALPWSLLAVQAAPGRTFSLTFCLNDMDPERGEGLAGQERAQERRLVDKCLALTPGIWNPKFPARFARASLAGYADPLARPRTDFGTATRPPLQPTPPQPPVADPDQRLLLCRALTAPGTDQQPLDLSVHCTTSAQAIPWPGLHLLWDEKNYASLSFDGEKTVILTVAQEGQQRSLTFDPGLEQATRLGLHLRLVLTANNLLAYCSPTGTAWTLLHALGARIGSPGKGPRTLALGALGATGPVPPLPDPSPQEPEAILPPLRLGLGRAVFRDLRIRTRPEPLLPEPPLPALAEGWMETLESVRRGLVPGHWTLLGPLPYDKACLAAEQNDDWTKIGGSGQEEEAPARTFWERPADDPGSHLNLGQVLKAGNESACYAGTGFDWPVEGEAILWFDHEGRADLWLNNRLLYTQPQPTHPRQAAIPDRRPIPVPLRKGANFLKLRLAQKTGRFGFCLSLERNDPGFRIALLKAMLRRFKGVEHPMLLAEGRLEIAREFERALDLPAAREALREAAKESAGDETQITAHLAELRLLEQLAAWEDLRACAETGLRKPALRTVASRSFRAAAGAILRRNPEDWAAVEDLLKPLLDPTLQPLETSAEALRAAAGLAAQFNRTEFRHAAWGRLGALENLPVRERAGAHFQSAVARLHEEQGRALREGSGYRPEAQALTAACASFRQGLLLLPGAARESVQAFQREAESDRAQGRLERAAAGYWAAAFLALLAESPSAPILLTGKAYPLPEPGEAPPAGEQARAEQVLRQMAGPQERWEPGWRAIGPFDLAEGGLSQVHSPETNPDPEATHQGSGEKALRWVKLDPRIPWQEGQGDLTAALGPWPRQVVYLAGSFTLQQTQATELALFAPAGWRIWIDGRFLQESERAGNPLAGQRIPLPLTAGSHRILLKLAGTAQAGPASFAIRLTHEPEWGLRLLAYAFEVRRNCATARSLDRWQYLNGILNAGQAHLPVQAQADLGEAARILCGADPELRWTIDQLLLGGLARQGALDQVSRLGWRVLRELELDPATPAGGKRIWATVQQLYIALAGGGEEERLDRWLREALSAYVLDPQTAGWALVCRAALRLDQGQFQAALPFYRRARLESSWNGPAVRWAAHGLQFVKEFRFERTILAQPSSVEFDNQARGAERSLGVGSQEDVEKAIRGLLELLKAPADSAFTLARDRSFPRWVGVKAFGRNLLASAAAAHPALFRAIAEAPAEDRLRRLPPNASAESLIQFAEEYPFTRAAIQALNRAGNRYLDQGAWERAATVFSQLAAEAQGELPSLEGRPRESGFSAPLVQAKLATACLRLGDLPRVRDCAQALAGPYAEMRIPQGEATCNGKEVARRLQQLLENAPAAPDGAAGPPAPTPPAAPAPAIPAGATEPTAPATPAAPAAPPTPAASATAPAPGAGAQSSTGPATPAAPAAPARPTQLAWRRPLRESSIQRKAAASLEPNPPPGLQTFPLLTSSRLLAASLDGIQAHDLASGRLLWEKTWPANAQMGDRPCGLPASLPCQAGERIFLRVFEKDCVALQARDAADGTLLWSSGVSSQLRNLCWLSDPAFCNGLLIAPFLKAGELNCHGLAALKAESGELAWRRDLILGNSGVRIERALHPLGIHLGPPTIEEGIVYADTGLHALCSVQALSGELNWLAGYPGVVIRTPDKGNSNFAEQLHPRRYRRLASRGPNSPLVAGEVVLTAARDASGLLALDRRTGRIAWQQEVNDCRFLLGPWQGLVFTFDETLRGIELERGETRWQASLQGEALRGRPALQEGLLYVPTDGGVQVYHAESGRLAWRIPLIPGSGPLHNLRLRDGLLAGVTEGEVVLLAPNAPQPAPDLAQRAAEQLRQGRAEEAAATLRDLAQAAQAKGALGEAVAASTRRCQLLQALGRSPEAQSEARPLLTALPETAHGLEGDWALSGRALAERLLPPPQPPLPAPTRSNGGVLAYAWQLNAPHSRILVPADETGDRFYVHSAEELCLVRAAPALEVLWKARLGPLIRSLTFGPAGVAVASAQELRLLDRGTGLANWSWRPGAERGSPGPPEQSAPIQSVSVGADAVFVVAGRRLLALEALGGAVRWSHLDPSRLAGQLYLGLHSGKVTELVAQPASESGPESVSYRRLDPRTGQILCLRRMNAKAGAARVLPAPDEKRLIAIFQSRDLWALDLERDEILWKAESNRLTEPGQPQEIALGFTQTADPARPLLHHFGTAWDGPDSRKWVRYHFDLGTGARTEYSLPPGWDFPVTPTSHAVVPPQARGSLQRMDLANGKWETRWSAPLPDEARYLYPKAAILDPEGRLLHYFYVLDRASPAQRLRLRLRTFDWSSGQFVAEETLPGQVVARASADRFPGAIRRLGELLCYEAGEGIFALHSAGLSRWESANQAEERLKGNPTLSALARHHLHTSLAILRPETVEALLAPPGVRVDGHLDEWAACEALLLDREGHFVPRAGLTAAPLPDPADLAARLYSGWDRRGLYLAAEVQDDRTVAPLPGALGGSGDGLRLVLNPRSNPQAGLDQRQVTLTLGAREGQTLLDLDSGGRPDLEEGVSAQAVLLPDHRGWRYEIFLPWPLLRPDPSARPGSNAELLLGLAVLDDDGTGSLQALEWGAAVTHPDSDPIRMGHLHLLPVSAEQIARYRKVIALDPESPDAWRYLTLILSSIRGTKAAEEKLAELKTFLQANPEGLNAARALVELRRLLAERSGTDAQARMLEAAAAARCPPPVLQSASSRCFRVWVYLDPKQPPNMVMLQFCLKDGGWCRRAYWGHRAVNWGQDRTPSCLPLGPLPEAGRWTLLEINAARLEMEDGQVVALGFTTAGGQTWFDRASAEVGGKETVLIEDALPAQVKAEGAQLRFDPVPRKSGATAWTSGVVRHLAHSTLTWPEGEAWFSFHDPQGPRPRSRPAEEQLRIWREAANLLPDSADALRFLDRAIGLQEVAVRPARAVEEFQDFLTRNPDSAMALPILTRLRQDFTQQGDPDPVARCEAIIERCRLPADARRIFNAQWANCWLDWEVLGPFDCESSAGGMDEVREPEEAEEVDLAWKAEGAAGLELSWRHISERKDARDQPNDRGPVRMQRHLLATLPDPATRKKIEGGPWFGYAYRKLADVPARREALLHYGASELISIWLNGKPVVKRDAPGNARDAGVRKVLLRAGVNHLLVKVAGKGGLQFFLRLSDLNGRPLDHLPKY